MTIEEAIARCESEIARLAGSKDLADVERAQEHIQLRDWLAELKLRRANAVAANDALAKLEKKLGELEKKLGEENDDDDDWDDDTDWDDVDDDDSLTEEVLNYDADKGRDFDFAYGN